MQVESDDYRIDSKPLGDVFIVQGDWKDTTERALRASGVRWLLLSIDDGFDRSDFSFLRELTFIEGLWIRVRRVVDFEPILALPRLRRLKLGEQGTATADFTSSSSLEVLDLDRWSSKRYGSALRCRRLREFLVSGLPGSDLASLRDMVGLELLSLVYSRLETLEGLGAKPLRRLYLSACSRLHSLRGIEDAVSLEKLFVYQAKSLTSLEGMESLLELRDLTLNQCPKLLSIKPLARLPKLEIVGLLGSTSVADGDMSPLKTLPSLMNTGFRDQDHYSHRASEFPRLPRPPVIGE